MATASNPVIPREFVEEICHRPRTQTHQPEYHLIIGCSQDIDMGYVFGRMWGRDAGHVTGVDSLLGGLMTLL